MKKLLLSIALVTASLRCLQAQIPNYSFENWSEYRQFSPRQWVGNGTVQRVPGNSGSALRLSHDQGALPSFAALANLSAGGFFGFHLPGFAYPSVPDSVNLLVRTNLGPGDTAQVLVVFTKNGNPISIETMRIWGNSSGTWKRSGIKMGNSGLVADSGLMIISSVASDLLAQQSGYLDVDSILFLNASGTLMTPVPNAGFSAWDSIQLMQPDRYLSSDRLFSNARFVVQNVYRDSRARSGSYSLKLQTGVATGLNGKDTLGASVLSSASGNPLDADPERPSFPVNARYASFRGFYQLNSVEDTAQAEINLFYQGNLVGNGVWRGAANTSGWTEFSAVINYDQLFSGTPDSATLFLSLSNNSGTSKKPGNWFLVDDLYLSAWSTSLNSSNNALHAQIYPNPARDQVFINLNSPAAGTLHYQLTDVSGRRASGGTCPVNSSGPQQCRLPLQGLAPGHYLLQFSIQGSYFQERILVQP
jgi:hypothetical protein